MRRQKIVRRIKGCAQIAPSPVSSDIIAVILGASVKLENHVLYYKPTCPFCVRVTNFMEDAGIECEMKNTLDADARAELVAINGRTQVPCLVIDGEPMLESADIIAYFSSLK
jgi:glutaredoxin